MDRNRIKVEMDKLARVKTGWQPAAKAQMKADNLRFGWHMRVSRLGNSKTTVLAEEYIRFIYK